MGDAETEALADLARANVAYNAPLSEARVDELTARLDVRPDRTILDLGCGDGRLLLRLCSSGARGRGIDVDGRAITRARAAAAAAGLSHQVSFEVADATADHAVADVAICVGASHAWGGREPALRALRDVTAPGGRLLYGDGFWRKEPSTAAIGIFGEQPTLDRLVADTVAAGWRPLYVGESTLGEMDLWESDWLAGLELASSEQARALADERRGQYFGVYRGILGFAWLILLRD